MGCTSSRQIKRRNASAITVDTTEFAKEMSIYDSSKPEYTPAASLATKLKQLDNYSIESDDEIVEVHIDLKIMPKQTVDIGRLIKQQDWDNIMIAILNDYELIGPKNIIGEVAKAGNYRMVNWLQEHGYSDVEGHR